MANNHTTAFKDTFLLPQPVNTLVDISQEFTTLGSCTDG